MGSFTRRGSAAWLVFRLAVTYGLMSMGLPDRGASRPTIVAANDVCIIDAAPRAGGTRESVDISFFERLMRATLKPHTW